MNKYVSLFVLLLGMLFSQGKSYAQPSPTPVPPDCVIFINNMTAAGSTANFPNYFTGCTTWTLQYSSVGFTGLTLAFQSAPAATSTTPGAFVSYAGTVSTGINPNTSTVGAISTFSNGIVDIAWVRVNLSGLTGSGTVFGVVYGYKSGYPGSSVSVSISCSAATPCAVDGPTAAGSAPTTPPVLAAGIDGTNIRTIRTDTGGRLDPASSSTALADDLSNTANLPLAGGAAASERILPYLFDGTTWDRKFYCPSQAAISVSAASSAQIIAASGATSIRVCHISFSQDVSANVTVQSGTGAVCATGTANLTGAYQNVLGVALDFGPESALTTAASQALCLSFSTSVTAGGIVRYAQF